MGRAAVAVCVISVLLRDRDQRASGAVLVILVLLPALVSAVLRPAKVD
jgi:hypothetical protein